MSSDNPSVIIEEEVQENGEVKHGSNNFSRTFGNVLRRSKRLMSGRRKEKTNSQTIPEQTDVVGLDNTDSKQQNDTNKNTDNQDQDSQEPGSPRGRLPSQTFYGSEKQVVRDGKKIKEIEVTGEKTSEPLDMKKQKKLSRKKSIDKEELNIPCRDLGKADHEGWLYKKAGGHGIVPVSWKRFWVVIKLGKLYCYKTSFNIAADYLLNIQDYTVDNATEKKKAFAFILKPTDEDKKQTVFAGETEEEINGWIDVINKVLSGIDLSNNENNVVPEYEERRKSFNMQKPKEDTHVRKRPPSAFMAAENETTGMPAGFGARTSSTSQPRVRKMSGTGNPSSVLSVGSMFHPLEETQDTSTNELKDLLYKEVTVETEVAAEEVHEPGEPVKQDEEPQPTVVEKPKSHSPPDVAPEVEKPKDVAVVNGDIGVKVPDVPKNEPEPSETPKSVVSEEVVQLEVRDDNRDKKSTSQLFKELSTEEDAESVIKQLEQEAKDEAATSPEIPVVEAKEENEEEEKKEVVVEEEKPEPPAPAKEKVKPSPVEEEVVAPTRKVDAPVADVVEAISTPTEEVKQPDVADVQSNEGVESPAEKPAEITDSSEGQQGGVVTLIETITITQSDDGQTETVVTETHEVVGDDINATGNDEIVEVAKPSVEPIDLSVEENRVSVASDASDNKPVLDLSPTVTETNVDLGYDLDIPTLDNGDSSLIDDITMELNSPKETSNLSNGTVIAAV